MENSVHYESGSKNNIAIVLSCPGQDEECATPPGPAKGQTGKNLEKVLEILSKKYKHHGFTRTEICITNAWDQVEYLRRTNRREAKLCEILTSKNLDRLAKEINPIEKIIICCGINAKKSVLALSNTGKINVNATILSIEHLGNQSLNSSIKKAVDGSKIKSYSKAEDKPADEPRSLKQIRKENRILRLEVVAYKLDQQISDKRNQN